MSPAPFSGFPRGSLFTPVPNPLFGPLLEEIQELAELKVTLRGMWLLHRKKGPLRCLTQEEFLADRTLMRGLGGGGLDPASEVRRGLELAVGRGTFLCHQEPGGSQIFLLNSEPGRQALDKLEGGAKSGQPDSVVPGLEPEGAVGERPNIYALYEENIGSLTPILAEELKEAEERYPWAWIREAFEITVMENKRSWRYAAGILRRWTAEGKGRVEGRDEGRDNGKPGRHTAKNQREKHIQDYERRWGRPAGPGSGGPSATR